MESELTREEIIRLLEKNAKSWLHEKVFKNKFPEIYNDLQKHTFPEDFHFVKKLYHYFQNDFELKLGVCPECGKRCYFKNFIEGYCKYCSHKCSHNSIKVKEQTIQTNRKNNGCDYPMQSAAVKEKSKQTCMRKYGVHHTGAAKECIEKRQHTCEEKYQSKTPFGNKKIQEKIKQTNLKTRGVENPSQDKKVQEKIEATMLKKHGVRRYGKLESGKQKMIERSTETKRKKTLEKNKDILEIFDDCFIVKCAIPNCKCGGQYRISKYMYFLRKRNKQECCVYANPISKHYSYEEKDLLKYISEIYNGNILENNKKVLDGQEIDIYLPDLKIGFEFNGDYWHMNPKFHKKDEILEQSGASAEEIWKFDKYKIDLAKNKGVDLYIIWEDDWLNNNEFTKQYIKELIHAKMV